MAGRGVGCGKRWKDLSVVEEGRILSSHHAKTGGQRYESRVPKKSLYE